MSNSRIDVLKALGLDKVASSKDRETAEHMQIVECAPGEIPDLPEGKSAMDGSWLHGKQYRSGIQESLERLASELQKPRVMAMLKHPFPEVVDTVMKLTFATNQDPGKTAELLVASAKNGDPEVMAGITKMVTYAAIGELMTLAAAIHMSIKLQPAAEIAIQKHKDSQGGHQQN